MSEPKDVDTEKWNPRKVENWAEFEEWVRDLGSEIFLFRGQPTAYGSLKPRLLRLFNGLRVCRNDILEVEGKLVEEFRQTAHIHLPDIPQALLLAPGQVELLQWWSLMQHYGAPTRVLDWTTVPHVAAYFAVEKDFNEVGEVLCYERDKFDQRWVDAKSQGKLVHLQPQLTRAQAGETIVQKWQPIPIRPVQLPRDAYLHDFGRVDGEPILHHFTRGIRTSRMAAQQGVFTVCTDVLQDHANLLEKFLGKKQETIGYRRLLIAPELKRKFLKELRLRNITGTALYPGIDGVGKGIYEKGILAVAELNGKRSRSAEPEGGS